MAGIGNERKHRSEEELESTVFKNDCYETPPWTVRSLLIREPKLCYSSCIIDPCSGLGSIVRELEDFRVTKFHRDCPHIVEDMEVVKRNVSGLYVPKPLKKRIVLASDIREGEKIEGVGGIDFLEESHLYYDDLRGTFCSFCYNPPFGPKGNRALGVDIVRRSLELVSDGGIVAVLQRLPFLESKTRYDRLFKYGHLKRAYQFTRRVQFYPEGQVNHFEKGKMAYAWFVFQKKWRRPPEMHWITDDPSDMGPGALLPQQVGMCYACYNYGNKLCRKANGVCRPIVDRYPDDHPKKGLRGKIRWTKDRECQDGDERLGLDIDHVCGGWAPRL